MPESKKIDLSEHALDVNPRRYSVDKLDLEELDDYIKALAGSRDYEYEAIRLIMKYLWGESYESIIDLAEENWKNKEVIRSRFHGNKDRFLNTLPLPDKLSGVCHMATGTGKSYVIFAVAYLSILLGKVDRVLVLTPSSTIIKEGLREKFSDYLFGTVGQRLKEKLPTRYKNKTVKLLKRNEAPEDSAIMVENINGVFQYFNDKDRNSIHEFFSSSEEVLVLSDEVHHAYSRLDFNNSGVSLSEDINVGGRQTEKQDEVRWMKFIHDAEAEKIKRHIGFTGTPYNSNDFFTDVIFNYSIKRAVDERYIKEIDSLIEYDEEINENQRFEQIIQTQEKNTTDYAYKENERPQVKPITVFISKSIASAERHAENFAEILAKHLRDHVDAYKDMPLAQVTGIAREKVITVTSTSSDAVEKKFNNIEEHDPNKVGGKVEYVFSVERLTEGWDADNVFQIVPMEERAFNSKLLISQVLGRGLRIPRKVRAGDIAQNYPELTVTNHESFSSQIDDLLNQVTQSELRFTSQIFADESSDRFDHHFNLFNINYISDRKTIEKDEPEQKSISRNLNLEQQEDDLKIRVKYRKGERDFSLSRDFLTIDQMTAEIKGRFTNQSFEREHFDFADGFTADELPEWDEIKEVIEQAMAEADIDNNKISKANQKKIGIFFNQYLPEGTSKVVPVSTEGDLVGISTKSIQNSTASAGGLDNYTSIFVSEEYQAELSDENLAIIAELEDNAKETHRDQSENQANLFKKNYEYNEEYIRQLIPGKRIFAVNKSLFKTPQGLVDVSHDPEQTFMFRLIENSTLVDSWVKSPDKSFYSLKYEFWKKGKDRTIKNFNPDFFIKLDLSDYITKVDTDSGKKYLRDLQDKGVQEIILVVEIKSDIELHERVAKAKNEAGIEHFEKLTKRLRKENPMNLPESVRDSSNQHYAFSLLHPEDYDGWFQQLRSGKILTDKKI